ncbi:hypothetical protein BCR43DRAFT_538433, partial [Syncephalastrum racemosum]
LLLLVRGQNPGVTAVLTEYIPHRKDRHTGESVVCLTTVLSYCKMGVLIPLGASYSQAFPLRLCLPLYLCYVFPRIMVSHGAYLMDRYCQDPVLTVSYTVLIPSCYVPSDWELEALSYFNIQEMKRICKSCSDNASYPNSKHLKSVEYGQENIIIGKMQPVDIAMMMKNAQQCADRT